MLLKMSAPTPTLPPFDMVATTMEMLPDQDERFRFLIDLGRKLPGLPEEDRTDEHFVHGCQSSVWITSKPSEKEPEKLVFNGESDAMIVSGLVAILLTLYSDHTSEEILAIDPKDKLGAMNLEQHLSPGRRNGLSEMIGRIRQYATESA